MKKYINTFLAFSILISSAKIIANENLNSANNSLSIDFSSLAKLIEKKNEKYLGAKQEKRAAEIRSGYLMRSYLPKVTVGGGYESFDLGSSRISDEQPYYGAEVSINIFNGGKDHLKSQVIDLEKNKKAIVSKITLADELTKARELYWNIIYNKEEKALLNFMIEKNKINLVAANKRIRSGVATPSDRLEFKMKGLDLERDLKKLKSESDHLHFELLALVGMSPQDSLEVRGNLNHSDEWEAELKHTHKDHEFLTKPFEYSVEQAKLKQKISSRGWTPKVDLYANYFQYNQKDEDFSNADERTKSAVGIRFTMDLFNSLDSLNVSEAQKSKAAAAEYTMLYEQRKNEAHFEGEILELKSLHDQVHNADEHIAMARKYYQTTQKEYRRGAKNSPDVLGAAERLENVIRTKNKLLRNFHIARSHVLSKLGR